MRKLTAVAVVLGVILAACAVDASADFGGGYGAFFTWMADSKAATSSAVSLSFMYRPDDVASATPTKTGFKVEPARFLFGVEQSVRDGNPDLNLLSVGYAFLSWETLEIIGEAGVLTQGIGEDTWSIGPFAGARLPFKAAGKLMEGKCGVGYLPATGEWALRLGLGFTTGN